jgi:predicted DNA-binding transcriptional regulator AlpA
MQEFANELQALRRAVFNTPRLHPKDVQRRYGWSKATFYRKLRELPRPIRFTGPMWRLEDLEAAELNGQIPRPVSG